MNQNIELSIAKLSAPVEILDIDQRACHALRRASVYSVAEVLLAGKPRLSSVKGIGSLTTDRIFEAVSGYLGLSAEQLTEEAAPEPGTACDVWETPIGALPISAATFYTLERVGCFRLDDLRKARANGYSKFLKLRAPELREIDETLKRYLARAAQMRLLALIGTQVISEALEPEFEPLPGAAPVLPLPELDERGWCVLERRAMQFLSLAEICARSEGLRKRNVRQVIRCAYEHVWQNLGTLRIFFDDFEQRAIVFEQSLGQDTLDLQTLVRQLMPDTTASDMRLEEKDVERTILVLRILVMYPSPWLAEKMEPRWPALLRLSCLVAPALAT